MTDFCAKGPTWRLRFGPYTLARYRRADTLCRGLWECSAHGLGVGGCQTPLAAFRTLRRYLREQEKQS